jgi:acetylornithine deacetylase/succinyl-diaminopimelate desuccinylase-like protein
VAVVDPGSKDREQAALAAIDAERLVETARRLIAQHSPTLAAGPAADELERILVADGWQIERPAADWPQSPAVVARLEGPAPGRTLQFDGHLDTVAQLPFVAPRVAGGALTGSGAADMKGGLAAAVEALRALRDTQALGAGGVLLTAHDHHEAPGGDGRQLQALARAGIVGDGALIPEYLADQLPLSGRGMAVFRLTMARAGDPVHEVFRDAGPEPLHAVAAAAAALRDLDAELVIAAGAAPRAERDTAFVGQVHAGEMYNQATALAFLEGTRRWVTPGQEAAAIASVRRVAESVAADFGVTAQLDVLMSMEAFSVAADTELVQLLRAAHRDVTGRVLPTGVKPFGDDGNRLWHATGIPALTHGPAGTGAHTIAERVPIAELVRVAKVYALTALRFCAG